CAVCNPVGLLKLSRRGQDALLGAVNHLFGARIQCRLTDAALSQIEELYRRRRSYQRTQLAVDVDAEANQNQRKHADDREHDLSGSDVLTQYVLQDGAEDNANEKGPC